MKLLFDILLLALGFIMLIKGADFLVEGASGIASRLGIPKLVVGLTIVAMGTSAPEAAVSITSALKGSADIAVGNVLGSNIMNILVILGITSCIIPLSLKKNTIKYEIPFMIIISVIFAFLGIRNNVINFSGGLILWGLFLCYLAYLFYMTKSGKMENEEEQENTNHTFIVLLLLTVVGMVLIILGSNVAVDAASDMATIFGVSKRLIGLTIVAFGTSLPELVTSITAARKKSADIAIGNIVGSNVFNILFVVGSSALITPVAYQEKFFIDSIIAIGASVLLFVLVLNKDMKLKRWGGIILLLSYIGYFIYLLI